MKKNIFRLRKGLNYFAIKEIRNLFRPVEKAKAIRVLRDIKDLYEHDKKKKMIINQSEEVNFGVTIILNMKAIVTEKRHYQLKNISIKVRQFLKVIINNIKKSDTWKIQPTIEINFISTIDNDEEHNAFKM